MRRGRRNNGGLAHVGDCGSGDNKEERERAKHDNGKERLRERAKHGVCDFDIFESQIRWVC